MDINVACHAASKHCHADKVCMGLTSLIYVTSRCGWLKFDQWMGTAASVIVHLMFWMHARYGGLGFGICQH
jgi:hypothetical protein